MKTTGLSPALRRVGFAGTPEFAASILDGLIAAGVHIVCVYTQPDRPTGRGRKLTPSPVKQTATSAGIEVRQPRSLRKNSEALRELETTELDLLIVAAYGLILPRAILDAPKMGCINVHASLLPRWRGAAPIERSIMAGDTQSGVCIMRMEAGLDTGGVYNQRTLPVTNTTTGKELHDAMIAPGIDALLQTLSEFDPHNFTAQDDSLATYAHKLAADDAVINWSEPAPTIIRHINALNDRLPARTWLGDEPIKLLRAAPASDSLATSLTTSPDAETDSTVTPGTIRSRSKKSITVAAGVEGKESISVREVQLNRGKGKPMPIAAALNGYAGLFEVGRRFSNTPGRPNS